MRPEKQAGSSQVWEAWGRWRGGDRAGESHGMDRGPLHSTPVDSLPVQGQDSPLLLGTSEAYRLLSARIKSAPGGFP